MRLLRLNPITRRRLQRFRRIRRGYYSLWILAAATLLSLFSNYIANNRAILVRHEGRVYFPTGKFYPMSEFGQEDEYGFDDAEADYRLLKQNARETGDFVLMPLIPFNPYESDFSYSSPPPTPPDRRHWLGTDRQGRDVLARLLYGLRVSMLFALALVGVSQTLGAALGLLQGYLAGRFDILSQRFVEIWSALPFLYIVLIMATLFRPGFALLLIVMTLFSWMSISFYLRTEIYREKAREYCLAARAIGASHTRILFRHLLPNSLTPLVTFTPFAIVGAISALTGLDYLGYGLPPPTPSWGELSDQALLPENRARLRLSLSPFVAITVTLTLVTLIGEAIREAFDPREFMVYK